LRSTCVEEEARRPLIISHQICPKPRFLRTSNKLNQKPLLYQVSVVTELASVGAGVELFAALA